MDIALYNAAFVPTIIVGFFIGSIQAIEVRHARAKRFHLGTPDVITEAAILF